MRKIKLFEQFRNDLKNIKEEYVFSKPDSKLSDIANEIRHGNLEGDNWELTVVDDNEDEDFDINDYDYNEFINHVADMLDQGKDSGDFDEEDVRWFIDFKHEDIEVEMEEEEEFIKKTTHCESCLGDGCVDCNGTGCSFDTMDLD